MRTILLFYFCKGARYMLQRVIALLQVAEKMPFLGATVKQILTLLGAPEPTEPETKETIPGLPQTPLIESSILGQSPQLPGQTPPVPGQTSQIPGLTSPLGDTAQIAQFSQAQQQGHPPHLPGQTQQPSPLAPPPLPVSPFSSNPQTQGQQPVLSLPGAPLDNGAGL